LRVAFPAGRNDLPTTLALMDKRGCRLRACQDEDLAYLRTLYGDVRAEELAPTGWPEQAKTAFLDSQFNLQHHHYVTHYADADFLLIEHEGTPIGRFYLDRRRPHYLVVDISLQQAWRGKGIGGQLLGIAQELAAADGAGVSLHVLQHNVQASKLYRRLGFRKVGSEGVHDYMCWEPPVG
jgi:ribosomal protein S18 acetylase RimI-like enzyme